MPTFTININQIKVNIPIHGFHGIYAYIYIFMFDIYIYMCVRVCCLSIYVSHIYLQSFMTFWLIQKNAQTDESLVVGFGSPGPLASSRPELLAVCHEKKLVQILATHQKINIESENTPLEEENQ